MGYTGEKKREYQREWLRKRRTAWLSDNGPCAKCGSWDDLEVDHINPSEKSPLLVGWNGTGKMWSWSKVRLAEELSKCQVLCKTCHSEKTAFEYEIKREHGRNMYEKYGCRCNVCKEAKRKNNAKRYER